MTAILVILGLGAVYLAINLAAAWFCLRPFRVPMYLSPGLMGFPQERVELDLGGPIIRGWWSPHPRPAGVVIAAHGFVMNRCEWIPLLPLFHQEGWSCLFMDLRGQGASSPASCTFGDKEREDVKAMIAWVRERHPELPIVLLGSSMGAASCVFAAAERPDDVQGLILDGVYSDLHQAGKGWWVMVGGRKLDLLLKLTLPLGSLFTGIKPRQLSVVQSLAPLSGKPMLFAYGSSDPIVPKPEAEKVVAAAGSAAEVEWFEGSGHGHGRFREPQRFHEACLRILKRAVAARPQGEVSSGSVGQ